MSIEWWKEYTRLPIRHKTLTTTVYTLYIAQEITEVFYILNDQLRKTWLRPFKDPCLQRENVILSTKELSALQGKPNTLLINTIEDIEFIK